MISKDVIEARIKMIKRKLSWSKSSFVLICIIKGIVWLTSMIPNFKVLKFSYEAMMGLDVLMIVAILAVAEESLKLCDVVINVSDRTSTPEDTKD